MFLFDIHRILSHRFPNCQIVLVDEFQNDELCKRARLEEGITYMNYKYDVNLLSMLTTKFQPRVVLINSCNNVFSRYLDWITEAMPQIATITHSHEIMKHYLSIMSRVPQFVVSNKIRDEYRVVTDHQPIQIQPPFHDRTTWESILRKSMYRVHHDAIRNSEGEIMPPGKTVIGMSGQLSERKNPGLFRQCAKRFPQHNFMWIGGDREKGVRQFAGVPNVFHIPNSTNPYQYFKMLDYFVLFSTVDPCPFVVIEALFLNITVVTFFDNMYYNHGLFSSSIGLLYKEYPGSISVESFSQVMKLLGPPHKNTGVGREYVLANFSEIRPEFIEEFSKRLS
jgi:glycosyltransferase involved in cell wall biosynthesis